MIEAETCSFNSDILGTGRFGMRQGVRTDYLRRCYKLLTIGRVTRDHTSHALFLSYHMAHKLQVGPFIVFPYKSPRFLSVTVNIRGNSSEKSRSLCMLLVPKNILFYSLKVNATGIDHSTPWNDVQQVVHSSYCHIGCNVLRLAHWNIGWPSPRA